MLGVLGGLMAYPGGLRCHVQFFKSFTNGHRPNSSFSCASIVTFQSDDQGLIVLLSQSANLHKKAAPEWGPQKRLAKEQREALPLGKAVIRRGTRSLARGAT